MNASKLAFPLLVFFPFVPSLPVLAHHGTAQYNLEHEVTVEGTVKQFEWTSPHSWIYVSVANDKGEIEEWGGETGAPGMMTRRGWTSHTLNPGDKIKMTGHAAKNGAKVMMLTKIQLADGKVMQ